MYLTSTGSVAHSSFAHQDANLDRSVHVTPQAVAMVGQLLNLIGHSLISNVVLPLPPGTL